MASRRVLLLLATTVLFVVLGAGCGVTASADTSASDELQAQIDEPSAQIDDVSVEVGDAANHLNDVVARLDELGGSSGTDLTDLESRVSKLEMSISDAVQGDISDRVATLEETLGSLCDAMSFSDSVALKTLRKRPARAGRRSPTSVNRSGE